MPKVDKKELMSKFNDFLNENLEQEEKESSLKSIDNNIKLMESIDSIMSKEPENDGLISFMAPYKNALANGAREEMLYESFTQGLGQFGYLRAVDTELSALKERIGKAKQNIDLTKILEMMNTTSSYYIVPLIESDVVDFMKEKTPNRKVLLLHHLNTFQYDPYVRQMINCIQLDNELPGIMVSEALNYGANSKAHVEKVYSPVQYIRENECVFNANGSFYVKKGNHISKLAKEGISALNETFVTLCQLVNDPRVEINDLFISLYHKNNSVKIYEGYAVINDSTDKETKQTLRNLNEMYTKYNNYDTELYVMTSLLLENYSKIAEVPFAKHVALNESDDKSLDLFKIKNNIFITTHNNKLKQHTFYRNVNPIQCANIINEHLDIKAEALFEDLTPNQDKIKKEIADTKEAYESKIQALKDKKEELQKVLKDADDAGDLDKAVSDIDEDIKKTEDDYRDWQDKVDDFENGARKDRSTDSELDDFADAADDATDDGSNDRDGIISVEKETEPKSIESDDSMEVPVQDQQDGPASIDNDTEIPDESETLDDFQSSDEAPEEDFDDQSAEASEDKFKIVKIDFAENVKTGERSNTGNAIVLVPMVDEDGNLVSEVQTIQFYIDNEGKIVLNNSGMTAEMYNAIIDAINADPNKSDITDNSYGASEDGSFNNPMQPADDTEEIDVVSDDDTLPNDFFEEAPKSGISKFLPKDQDSLEESLLISDIAGAFTVMNESKQEKKIFLNKRGLLNEDEYSDGKDDIEDIEPEDVEDDDAEDLEDEDTRTSLEKLQQAAEAYIDYENDSAEVTDISTDSTNFGDISKFTFTINENNWVFFELNDKIYSMQEDSYDKIIEDSDTEDEFEAALKDDEEVESMNKDASIDKLFTLLTDVISVETGEDFEFDTDTYLGKKESSEDFKDDDNYDDDLDIDESVKVKLTGKKDQKVDLTGKDSVKSDEAENGTDDEKADDKKIEDAQKTDSSTDASTADSSVADASANEQELPRIRLKKVNESAEFLPLIPEPNDSVIFKGKRGVVQSVRSDGTVTLMVEGMTVECTAKDFKITTNRKDTMKAPFKYDPKTQAALYEQLVSCGIFQEGTQINGEKCFVNYAEWERKKDWQNVTVISEGSHILMPKKNVKLFEDVNDFASMNDYIEGVYMDKNQAESNIMINALDYSGAEAGNEPVRCIIGLGEEPKLVTLPKDSIRTLAV